MVDEGIVPVDHRNPLVRKQGQLDIPNG